MNAYQNIRDLSLKKMSSLRMMKEGFDKLYKEYPQETTVHLQDDFIRHKNDLIEIGEIVRLFSYDEAGNSLYFFSLA